MPSKVRASLFPTRPNRVLGSYSMTLVGRSAAGPAANADFVSVRWGNASNIAVVTACSLRVASAVASTVEHPSCGVFVARGFTASDTGGTAVTLGGNVFKKRTSDPASLLTDARFVSNAALTPGTRTLDAAPLLGATAGQASGSVMGPEATLFSEDPLILAQNEGLIVRQQVAITTGIVAYAFHLEWLELSGTSLVF